MDVVVIGAGAAGCALAARLAATGRHVLLLEGGSRETGPLLQVPMGFVRTMNRPRLTHRYEARPSVDAGRGVGGHVGPTETWLRGRGVGGSMLVNGTMYLRGEPHLYDALAAELGPRWSWSAFERAFEHIEDQLPIRRPAPVGDSPVLRGLVDALAHTGVPHTGDVRRAAGPRVGTPPATIGPRGRLTAVDLLGGRSRAGLPGLDVRDPSGGRVQILPRTRAIRVVLRSGRAIGVEVAHGSDRTVLRAPQIVLAGGTLETPLLLERSGIGDPERLRAVGIRPQVDSPRVGEGLREQRGATVKARLRPGLGLNERLASRRGRALAVVQYLAARTGPLATGPFDLAASVDSRGGRRPDLQLLLTELSTDGTGLAPAEHAGLMVQAYALTPNATGSVHATGPDLDDAPTVRAPLLADARDRAAGARALEAARAVLAAPALAELVVDEELPGAIAPPGDDDAAADFVRASGAGIYHAIGTCAAGGPEAVLDERLRVRGVDGLRVADLSALPTHTSGGTAAVAMALGHLAGTWIIEDLA